MEEKIKEELKEVSGILGKKENEIEGMEATIAKEIRKISKKIFERNKYRMKKQHLVDTGHYDWIWADVIIMVRDEIKFRNGSFFGWADTLRITTAGEIVIVTQRVHDCRRYDLSEGNISIMGYDGESRVENATDKQIAENAKEIGKQLLSSLGKRIDICQEEKKTLKQIVSVI